MKKYNFSVGKWNVSCTCTASNSTCGNAAGCFVCLANLGYSFFPGSTTIQQFNAPSTGPYTVQVRVVNGSPPSGFTVLVNGNAVATIPGSGGNAIVSVEQGNLVQIQANWGLNYLGGQVEVVTCPPLQQPTPTPPPSQTGNYVLYIVALVAAIVVVLFFIMSMLKRRSSGQSPK